MSFIGLALILGNAAYAPVQDQPREITKTTSFPKRLWSMPSKELGTLQAGDEVIPKLQPVVVIRGDNITVDFGGGTIQGSPLTTEPDERMGQAIEVVGNNVTIKNVNVHGYKVGLIARNAKGLKILDSDFSYNWKQHLKSDKEKEDGADWQSYHHNEHDEWLRYGAGIYLSGCENFEVKNTRAVGGQCGLMLNRSNHGKIWNNDFSFLSGVGLGLYRSSDNVVMHNNIDWCVRGYSHGVYNRGQDSAGILIFEQCNKNTFAYNSVTHGGDGFFLWAGQTTMDTGKGGCNDNLLYGNDFSHAPTNGIEATFSRNAFVNNLLLECWHGVWGGYSYNTNILGNTFGLNAQGIAIEHGQDNLISKNLFSRNNESMELWSNPSQDPNWGYPKGHDTRSRDYSITDNVFSNEARGEIRVRRTDGLQILNNTFRRSGKALVTEPTATRVVFTGNQIHATSENSVLPTGVDLAANKIVNAGADADKPLDSTMQGSGNEVLGKDPATADYLKRFEIPWKPWPSRDAQYKDIEKYAPMPLQGGKNPFLPKGSVRGRRFILIDEWGPYDFKSPILSPTIDPSPGTKRFDILGPKGTWKVVTADGIEKVSSQSGSVPGAIEISLAKGKASNINLVLEYAGEETTDYRGITSPKGTPVRFSYRQFFAPIDWTVKFYAWSKSSGTDEHSGPDEAAIQQIWKGAPLKEVKNDRLDYASGGSFLPGLPNDHFSTVADGTFDITPGDYTLEITSDDGCRVWVDDRKVIDQWHYEGPTTYTADLKLTGHHKIHVEHFEIDGYSALKVSLHPKK